MTNSVGIRGFGYAVPASVRTNDDPIFRELLDAGGGAESAFFSGTRERRYLAAGESVEELMAAAGRMALADARLAPEQIDRLYGTAFVSEYLTPNGLYKVHAALALEPRVMVVPVNNEFSNFITGLVLAWEAVASGRCEYAMVNVGGAMTRYMDYAHGHAAGIGDGAGCAIVARGSGFIFVDSATLTLSEVFDVMNMRCRFEGPEGQRTLRTDDAGFPMPVYEMGGAGLQTVMNQGVEVPPDLVLGLLRRNGIDSRRVAMISHQPAPALTKQWDRAIAPGQYLDTFEEYGNMTAASVPVTLAKHRDAITTDYVVLLSPGTGTHFSALLLKR